MPRPNVPRGESALLNMSALILIWTILTLIFFWLLGHVIGTVVMLLTAALLAFAIYPLVTFFQRFLPRLLSTLIVYLGILLLLFALISNLFIVVLNEINALIQLLQSSLNTPTATPLTTLLNNLGISQATVDSATQLLITKLQNLLHNVGPWLGNIIGLLGSLLLVFMISVFLIADGGRASNWFRQSTPLSQRRGIHFLIDMLQRVAGGYIRGQLLLSALLSIITGIAMAIIGIPYAALLAILCFFMSFIPTFGAFITGCTCVLFALTQGWDTTVLATVFLIILQVVERQLSPRLLGKTVGIHPLFALVALIAGAELFGIIGAIFAPIIAGCCRLSSRPVGPPGVPAILKSFQSKTVGK
ncbi:MAG TPA: AI-2E family transporter [Ktedonobacteraceae bacterium]